MKNWFKKHSKGIEMAMDVVSLVVLCTMCMLSGVMLAANFYKFTLHPSIPVVYWVLCALWWLEFMGLTAVKNHNYKRNKRIINTHEIAANIVDEFEELLDVHDITIPDKWREGDECEARIFGKTYDDLLESVETMVINTILTAKDGEVIEIISDRF